MNDLAGIHDRIRLVSLDCDGVMTDGTLYYGEDGRQWRAFHVHDGVGIRMLIEAGLEVAFVTASRTAAIERRAEVLGVPPLPGRRRRQAGSARRAVRTPRDRLRARWPIWGTT